LDKARQARINFPKLIELFDQYNIPVTWATVGHLLLKECSDDSHDWMQRIPYFNNRCWKYVQGDWFDHDPHSSLEKDPEWYAPDLVESILGSVTEHEIATHTFSHIDFSYKNCPREVAEDEMQACVNAMKTYNLKMESICFPSGTWGHTEILKKYGIKIYRKKLDKDVVAYPYRDKDDMLVTPTSESLGRLHESWSAEYYISRYVKNIQKAIRTGTIAHFMFHPSMDEWTVNHVMPKVLEHAFNKRLKGELWIGTMADIARYINSNAVI
jgi:hypothetical protein